MEKTVRILEQSALSTRKYTDKKSGQEKVMNAVTFKLTDGVDTFLGEVTGERAVNCPMYLQGAVFNGCERLAVSANWRTDAGYDDLRR